MFFTPSALQKRAWANGRSRLTVTALILSPNELIDSLNFFVCIAQTGVSSDGTTLNNVGLPLRSASFSSLRPPSK